MAKQSRESNRRRFNQNEDEPISKGPDPTINKDLIHSAIEVEPEVEEVERQPEPKAATPVQVPVIAPVPVVIPTDSIINKRTRARQAARSKSLADARQQIFHRVGKGGLALGDPVKILRDEDLNESE